MTNKECEVKPYSVSKGWERKFSIFDRIQASGNSIYHVMPSESYQNLRFTEKNTIGFNVWAFLFGAFYYFCKTMWTRGLVLLGCIWLLSASFMLLEMLFNVSMNPLFYWIPGSVVCAQLANYDYYQHITKGEIFWRPTSILAKPSAAIMFAAIALIMVVGASLWLPQNSKQQEKLILEDISGIWNTDSRGEEVVFFLTKKTPFVKISGTKIPITIKHIDIKDHSIVFKLSVRGENKRWAVQKVFGTDGSFRLQLLMHNGAKETLGFVRNI